MIERRSSVRGGELPGEITVALRGLIRRARLVILVRGLGAALALTVGAFLAVMAVDAGLVIFSPAVRYALTGTAAVGSLAGLVWFLGRPLARAMTLRGIARAIESQHPELEERISSAVELLDSGDSADVRGSQALIAALVAEARHDVRRITPKREITLHRARRALIAALCVTGVLCSLLAAWPARTSRLLLRALAPNMNLPNLSADDLRIRPGDTVVTAGDKLRVEVEVENAPVRQADLRIEGRGGDRVVAMERVFSREGGPPRFALTTDPLERSFRYRVHAGDALSRYYRATVVPFPEATQVQVTYDYPPYTGMQPQSEEPEAGRIAAVAGTEVTIAASTNTRVARADLVVNGRVPAGVEAGLLPQQDGTTECRFRLQLAPELQGRWRIELTDAYGFANKPDEGEIDVLPDEPPTVAVLSPGEDKLRLSPTDRLPVEFLARDDFGLSALDFVLETDRQSLPAVPVALEDVGPSASGVDFLDLAKLSLTGARQLTFRLRAADNLPGQARGPQVSLSKPFTIELDRAASSYAEQALVTWEEHIRTSLQDVLEKLQNARKVSDELLPHVGTPGPLPEEPQKQVDELVAQLDAAEKRTRELAAETPWSRFAELTPRLQRVADEHVAPAEDKAGQIKLVDTAPERQAAADEADFQTGMAIATVTDMLREFDVMAEAARRELQLQELAAREEELAGAAQALEESAESAPLSEEAWRQEQDGLADGVDDALGRAMREAAERLALADLAEQARALKTQQETLGRDTEQLRRVQEQDAELLRLAQEQDELASDSDANPRAKDQGGRMRMAADQIRSYDMEQALLNQDAAGGTLGGRANAFREELLTAQIAERAAAIAQEQGSLAEGGLTADEADRQRELGEQVKQLRQEAGRAGWSTGNIMDRNSPAGQMSAAAQRAEEGNAEAAAAEAGRAAQRAGNMAEELRKRVAGFHPVDDKPGEQAKLEALAQRQYDLRNRTRNAWSRREDALRRLQEGQLRRLQEAQNEVAGEAARLAGRARDRAPQQDQLETRAAREAAVSARRLAAEDLDHAAEQADRAAEDLAGLASRLDGNEEPTVRPLRQDAAYLAQRQDRLADEMRMLAGADQSELAEARQGELRDQTDGLRSDAEAVRDLLAEVAPGDRAVREASTGAEQTVRARDAETGAQSAIAEARTAEAIGPQREATSALNAAALAFDRLNNRLQEVADRDRASELGAARAQETGPVADAAEAARRAAQSAAAEDTAEAADHLRAAAGRAEERSRALGLRRLGRPMLRSVAALPSRSEPGLRRQGPTDGRPPDLRAIGLTTEDWARLPSRLRGEVLQAAGDDVPPEYRALVKSYFRAVARRSVAPTPAGASDSGGNE